MRAGQLNRKISIRKSTSTSDSYGGQVPTWSTFLNDAWARVRPLSMREMWQADHTVLDILVLDDAGTPVRPWLTVIVDDHSRAIAGYFLSLDAPSALNTALALRQAIWRKPNPEWIVSGIPEQLYVDNVLGREAAAENSQQISLRRACRR